MSLEYLLDTNVLSSHLPLRAEYPPASPTLFGWVCRTYVRPHKIDGRDLEDDHVDE